MGSSAFPGVFLGGRWGFAGVGCGCRDLDFWVCLSMERVLVTASAIRGVCFFGAVGRFLDGGGGGGCKKRYG